MNTSVKITVLVDTESFDENLAKEHGFSAWIETEGRHILFDTGQTGGMLVNAERLNIDLKKADTLVLSHGHFDHTGQIPQFLELNDHARIYCCADLDRTRYSCKIGTAPRSIGMPDASKKALSSISASRIHELGTPRYLTPRVGMTGPVPRESLLEDTGGPFFLDDHRGVDDLIERATKNSASGDIVLFHNDSKYIVQALPGILAKYQAEGFEVVPVSELLLQGETTIDNTGRQHQKEPATNTI